VFTIQQQYVTEQTHQSNLKYSQNMNMELRLFDP